MRQKKFWQKCKRAICKSETPVERRVEKHPVPLSQHTIVSSYPTAAFPPFPQLYTSNKHSPRLESESDGDGGLASG